jgi:predicted transcriptional regulator of viral defense system
MPTSTQDIIDLASRRGILRAADLECHGLSRTLLPYLAKTGVLRRIARGAYVLTNHISSHEGFLEVVAAVPSGVICLLSALQFHELTTQLPSESWVAIEYGRTRPKATGLALRIVKLREPAFSAGIEEHKVDGAVLRVYSPAKTVVDCFKFRNRIGIDIAREALVDCLEQKKATRDDIYRHAKLCRMTRVMRPYLEMV